MKKIGYFLAGVALLGGLFSATVASAAGSKPEVTVTVDVANQYVNPVAGVSSEDYNILGGIRLGYEGFFVKAEKMEPLLGGNIPHKFDFRNETRLSAGWNGELGGNFVAGADIVYYDLVQDLVATEYSAELGYKVTPGLTPFVKSTYCVLNQESVDNAFWFFAGVHAKASVSKSVVITGTAQLYHDNGAYGLDGTNGYSVEVAPTVKVNDWLALNASARVVGPFGTPEDGRKTEFVYGAGITATF